MDLKELELLSGDQESHWYYASKSAALRKCLRDRSPEVILDVGAGSGFFTKVLLRDTTARSATCVDTGYPTDWSEIHFAKSISFRRTGGDPDADLVLFMDVLEHVDDDVGLLRAHVARARSGTRFVVSVPAFSWLWSSHDDFLHHRRRYTLSGVHELLSAAGLAPLTGFYFFGGLFPAVAAQRIWRRWRGAPDARTPRSDLRRHHPLTNAMLRRLCL